ncbi:hypothetical protein Q5Y75_15130 [Ruegeria sp. 2205SS24-7]|nr:hypothetical protein [Ruegeria sp. 2205SS24-7]MDP5218560.1 hypothetical protein [Ruegeria sp. 2205SS24-7]
MILQTPEEFETWLTAPWEEADGLQRALPEGLLEVVARGGATDGWFVSLA